MPLSGARRGAAPPPVPIPVPGAGKGDGQPYVYDRPANPDEEEIALVAFRQSPPWLVSAVVHMVLIVSLGLWLTKDKRNDSGLVLSVSDQIGEQLDDPSMTLSTDQGEADEMVITPSNLAAVDDPFAAPPEVEVSLFGESKQTELTAPTIGLALVGRETGSKEVLLRKYGGTAESEGAVGLGLEWLKRQQRSDGRWSLKGPYTSGSLDARDASEAATAMALLAFQGAGNTHQHGPYKKQVAAGLKALLKMQDGEGNFYQPGGGRNNWLYCQAQCTIALCELYGMSKDSALRLPAELAVKFCVEAQDRDLGGWRYMPRNDSDTSVTGWMVMALQSARMAGLEVPSTTLEKISEYLNRVTPDGIRYAYQLQMDPTLVMTAEALLCREYLGWKQDDPRLVAGAEILLDHLPRYEDRDVYYWYYGTQMMHHMEGKYWVAWNNAMRDMLVAEQEKQGSERGSWDPLGQHPDKWANLGFGGRLYTTCLSLYVLEVYYRHLPIYAGLNRAAAK